MMSFKKTSVLLASFCFVFSLSARQAILEFKGAYFLPTNCEFKKIYHKGGALFGPELTVQLCEDRNWYAFASVDFFKKRGHSIGLCDPTTVRLIPLALGLKYFMPAETKRTDLDFYVGLGFQPVNVRTKNCSEFVAPKLSQWGFGGIVKVGVYWYIPCNFVLDFFIDYSFVRVGRKECSACPYFNTFVQPVRANVSGAIFGGGLGYSF